MRRRRTLIASPLEWQMTALPVAPPALPAVAQRGGTELRTPRPVVIVDTREQNPFSFTWFSGWFAGVRKDLSLSGITAWRAWKNAAWSSGKTSPTW